MDKIVEGRACGVDEWLIDSFAELCKRDKLLTTEEGKRLGVEDVLLVARVREHMKDPSKSSPSPPDIHDTFSLRVWEAASSFPSLTPYTKADSKKTDNKPESDALTSGETMEKESIKASKKDDGPTECKKDDAVEPANSENLAVRPSPFGTSKGSTKYGYVPFHPGWKEGKKDGGSSLVSKPDSATGSRHFIVP